MTEATSERFTLSVCLNYERFECCLCNRVLNEYKKNREMKQTRIGFYFRYYMRCGCLKLFRHSCAQRHSDSWTVMHAEMRQFSNRYFDKDTFCNGRDSTHCASGSANQKRKEMRSTINDVEGTEDGVPDEEQRLCDLQVKSMSFLAMVDETALDPRQLAIHRAHVLALKVSFFLSFFKREHQAKKHQVLL